MHDKDQLQRAKLIFWDAVENLQPAEWVRYVEEQCEGDERLRDQVHDLLNAHEVMSDFMNEPAFAGVGVPTAERASRDCLVGQRKGEYKILERLGEGGMGTVYVAEQTSPVRRQVALKIIKSGLEGKQVLARFEAEKQALALMDHPNVARVFDAGTTEHGTQFFVMELVKGVPITEFCDQHALTISERLSLFQSVCQAVQHAHQKGIIHRDLKPSNILVAMYNTTPVPKVIDFGIAKFAHGQRIGPHSLYTAFSQILGTPLYMSPEQANLNAIDVDTRTDIYSLGVLLYELLTGTTPFDKETLLNAGLDEMRRIIREVEPMRPSKRVTTLSLTKPNTVAARRSLASPFQQHVKLKRNELDWIVMKCLEKDRTRRYESASGLAEDVQRYLKDEPVVACPPSFGYRLNKAIRRNRAWLIPACLVLGILVISTAVSTDQALRARRAGAVADANFGLISDFSGW